MCAGQQQPTQSSQGSQSTEKSGPPATTAPGHQHEAPIFKIVFHANELKAFYKADPAKFYAWMSKMLQDVGTHVPREAQAPKREVHHSTTCQEGECYF